MSNPYTPGFAAPSRTEWARLTTRWLKKHQGLKPTDIADMLGLAPNAAHTLRSPQRQAWWYYELLGALVANWRPRKVWTDGDPLAQDLLDKVVNDRTMSPDDFAYWFPIAPPRWADTLYEGVKACRVPVRLAVVADALDAGALPCGLPFAEWSA